MEEKKFIFILQLILPMCSTKMSGIKNDHEMPYYHKLEEWSNLYVYQIGLGGSYRHDFKNIKIAKIVRHDGCTVHDGVRGRSLCAIYRRWQKGADYDDYISTALPFH